MAALNCAAVRHEYRVSNRDINPEQCIASLNTKGESGATLRKSHHHHLGLHSRGDSWGNNLNAEQPQARALPLTDVVLPRIRQVLREKKRKTIFPCDFEWFGFFN